MTEQSELHMAEGPADGERAADGERPSLGKLVGSLAHALEDRLGAGDVAELRRLDPRDPSSPAFWKVAAHYLEPAGQLLAGGEARDRAERKWAAVVSGLAQAGHLHQPGLRLGRALAEAGMAELRFVRLLRAHEEALLDLIRTTGKYLAAKGQPADWTDVAWLALSDGRTDEERVRRRLARDYYRHLGA